jgi:retron-type reverse transcriptase
MIPRRHGKDGQYEATVPVIADRALQALTSAALEPEWEARFESRSYGFRPGRSCQDAMQAIFVTARGKTCKRVWALDAGLAAAFDQLDHSHLLKQLGTFPARGNGRGLAEVRGDRSGPVRSDRAGQPARRSDHAPNAKGNFCFEATLGYRRLERGR